MVNLSEAAQTIAAAKQENWKNLLFAQVLLEDANETLSCRQLSDENNFFSIGMPIGGITSKNFYEALSSELSNLHASSRRNKKAPQKSKRLPCKDERQPF